MQLPLLRKHHNLSVRNAASRMVGRGGVDPDVYGVSGVSYALLLYHAPTTLRLGVNGFIFGTTVNTLSEPHRLPPAPLDCELSMPIHRRSSE